MNNGAFLSSLFLLDPGLNMMATKCVTLIWVAVTGIAATPKGAPQEACEDLVPKHGDAKPQSEDPRFIPYNVKVHEADSETREMFQSILYILYLGERNFCETRRHS